MGVQVSNNNSNKPFVLFENPGAVKQDSVIVQNGARTTDLLCKTLMAKNATTGKYEPYQDETAIDGTARPAGIYMGPDIPFADIVAGDVTDVKILTGDAYIDKNQLLIENSKTLATVIATGTLEARTVEDELNKIGIFAEDTVDITEFQNA